MGDERALAAIGRIERALARVEGVASAPPPAADERLAAAHRNLRGKVEVAIAQIDALLAAKDGG